MIFAAAFVLAVLLPINLGRLDGTAFTELSFVLAFAAAAGFAELFCSIGKFGGVFGKAKFAALSLFMCAVMTVIRTFEQWFTFIGLTELNSGETFNAFLRGNILLHLCVFAAVTAFGFIIHRNRKAVSEV